MNVVNMNPYTLNEKAVSELIRVKAVQDRIGIHTILKYYNNDEERLDSLKDILDYLYDVLDNLANKEEECKQIALLRARGDIQVRHQRVRKETIQLYHKERIKKFIRIVEENPDEYYLLCNSFCAYGDNNQTVLKLYAIEPVGECDVCEMVFTPYCKKPKFKRTDSTIFWQLYDVETDESVGDPFSGNDLHSIETFSSYLTSLKNRYTIDKYLTEPLLLRDAESAMTMYEELDFEIHIYKDCGMHFPLTYKEKAWFDNMGFKYPVRCKHCRNRHRNADFLKEMELYGKSDF